MINCPIIKNKDLNLSIIDVNIYKNFSLNNSIKCDKIEFVDAEIVFFEPESVSNITNSNYEILFDYEFRSKEIDNKLLKLRENLAERSNSNDKGLFSFSRFKTFAKTVLNFK